MPTGQRGGRDGMTTPLARCRRGRSTASTLHPLHGGTAVDYGGFAGDTIASALAAHGVTVFSRSFKYHRPRGILTAAFHDPNRMVQVGDEPNVRGAHRQLEAGMDVRTQNVWPSLAASTSRPPTSSSAGSSAPGFYYKTFIKPQRLWPAYQKVLSRFAAGGRHRHEQPHVELDKRYAHADVCVAGGGPAGMAAAIAAAETGARVLLVEEEHRLGGHLRCGRTRPSSRRWPSCGTSARRTGEHRGHDELRRRRPLRRQLAVGRRAPAGHGRSSGCSRSASQARSWRRPA